MLSQESLIDKPSIQYYDLLTNKLSISKDTTLPTWPGYEPRINTFQQIEKTSFVNHRFPA